MFFYQLHDFFLHRRFASLFRYNFTYCLCKRIWQDSKTFLAFWKLARLFKPNQWHLYLRIILFDLRLSESPGCLSRLKLTKVSLCLIYFVFEVFTFLLVKFFLLLNLALNFFHLCFQRYFFLKIKFWILHSLDSSWSLNNSYFLAWNEFGCFSHKTKGWKLSTLWYSCKRLKLVYLLSQFLASLKPLLFS